MKNKSSKKAVVKIGGEEYELVLTASSMGDILRMLKDTPVAGESSDIVKLGASIDQIACVVCSLANAGIERGNHGNGSKRKLLTVDEIERLTTPTELFSFSPAIMAAIAQGTGKNRH